MLRFNKNYIKICINTVLYKLILDLIYSNYISTTFNYNGFNNHFTITNFIVSMILLISSLPYIIKLLSKNNISNILISILYYLSYIPMCSMISFNETPVPMIIYLIIFWLSIYISNLVLPPFKIKRPTKKTSQTCFLFFLILFIVSTLYYSYKYGGFRLHFGIYDVYDLRDIARNFNMPKILAYIVGAMRYLGPMLIVFFISEKAKISAGFFIVLQFLMFSVDGSKSALFTMILGIMIYYIFDEAKIKKIPWAFVSLCTCSILEEILHKSIFFIDLIIRRVLFLPQLLNYNYYDFFSTNQIDFYRQSILGNLGIKSAYTTPIPNIIGDLYYNKPQMYANNGLFSDAYSNLGFVGMIVFPIILVIIIKLIEAVSTDIEKKFILCAMVPICLTIISSSIFIVLTSHGLLLIILFLFILPRKSEVMT